VTCRYHFISTCIKPLNSRGKHLETPPPGTAIQNAFLNQKRQWRKPADEIFVYQPLTRKTGLTHFGQATRKQYPRSQKNNTKENHARLKKITQLSHRCTSSKSPLVPAVLAIVLVRHPRRKEMFPA